MYKLSSISIFLLLVLNSCERKVTDIGINILKIEDRNGRYSHKLRCIEFCDSDTPRLILCSYDTSGKLAYIEETQDGKLSNSLAMGYAGSNMEMKIVAGYYLYNEYFNNSLISTYKPADRVLLDLIDDKQNPEKFKLFVDSIVKLNFSIQFDSIYIDNLHHYLTH